MKIIQNDKFFACRFTDEDIAAAKLRVEVGCRERFNNDEDCTQMPAFVPIKRELVEVFKYWYRKAIDYEILYSYCGFAHGRQERFEQWLAATRFQETRALLQEQIAQDAIDDVQKEFRSGTHGGFVDEKDWDIYFNGTEDEKLELQSRTRSWFL